METGKVSKFYLALDQGMVMASLANALGHDQLQRYLAPRLERRVKPLLAMEQFTAGEGAR